MNSDAVLDSQPRPAAVIEFGPFRFDPLRRELADGKGPIRMSGRALHILQVLLEHPGRLYSRDELISRVWVHTMVEQTSLRVQLSALRRALGDGKDGARYISNVPGRGYVFVAEIRALPRVLKVDIPAFAGQNLPSRLTRPVGRSQVIAELGALLACERLVSIVGAGGMGKTTVALAVAARLQSAYPQGVYFVDLSKISDPALVAVELGQTQGLDVSQGSPPGALEAMLQDRHLLFVMDNCEHVVDAAARLMERLMRACPSVHFLATSREPLEVEAEWVFRLPALASPGPQEHLDLADVLAYPAVQLFVERANAKCETFNLTEANAPAVRQLCRFLDGIPLAIELAAARVDCLGVDGLLCGLEDALELLTRGQRTARPRHRTLNAVLDWSYELLSDGEKSVLQRLSVFRGSFDLEGAVTLATCENLSRQQVVRDLLGLCAKSLIVLDAAEGGQQLHRLLYVTRLYAEKRLAASPEETAVRRRHAALILDELLKAQQAGRGMSQYRWSPALGSYFPDLRAAIEWAMVLEHDLVLGLELTVHAKRPYYDVGLFEEYRRHLDMALGKVARAKAERERLEMGLRVASVFMTGYALDGGESLVPTFSRARELVAHVGSQEDRIEALCGMGTGFYGQGDYRSVLSICDEIRQLATGEFEPLSVAVCDRLSALSLHGLGEHDAAERLAHGVIAFNGARVGRRFLSEVPFGVSMRTQLARIHWLRADFSLAWSTLQDALDLSVGAHVYARCQVLGTAAIPMALWKGDLALADQWVCELSDLAERRHVLYWQTFARVFRRIVNDEEIASGSDEELSMEKCAQLGDLVATLRCQPPLASTVLRVEQGAAGWCAPEVMRLQALPNLRSADALLNDRAAASMMQSMELAHIQGASFWTLRIALCLCSSATGDAVDQTALRALRAVMATKDDGSRIPALVAARILLRERTAPGRQS